MQIVLRAKIKFMREERKVKGGIKGFRGEIKGTRADEENERCRSCYGKIKMRVHIECVREEKQLITRVNKWHKS